MPADGTQIKQDIDNNLGNKGYRGVRVFNIITALKAVVDWVAGAVNGNLSTWLRTSDNQPGGANSDEVFRTGRVDFKGGLIGRARQKDTKSLALQPFGVLAGVEITANQPGAAAFMEFQVPNVAVHQLGIDTDGVFKVHPWGTTTSYDLVASGYNNKIATSNTLANRKLVLVEVATNDHQFFGWGVLAGQLRHQISSVSDAHVFVAGSSPATSAELVRIQGNGRVGIGTTAPRRPLDVTGDVAINGRLALATDSGTATPTWHMANIADQFWLFRQPTIEGNGNIFIAVSNNGNVGIGVNHTAPTSSLHVKGAAGHNQFRLETAYTPSSSSDVNGQLGQLAWDTNYIYVKTSGGWRRSALSSF